MDLETRQLALLLGLGDLGPSECCHGYANCCVCCDCREREEIVKVRAMRPRRVALPWEEDAAA